MSKVTTVDQPHYVESDVLHHWGCITSLIYYTFTHFREIVHQGT